VKGQQNIIVTVILVLVVLGLLSYTITMVQGKTKTTVDQAGNKWDEIINELNKA
jgi:hypothetical protein